MNLSKLVLDRHLDAYGRAWPGPVKFLGYWVQIP